MVFMVPTEGLDERSIIERVLSGERDEFAHLVRAHQAQIYALIARQVGMDQVAKDLTQDTLLKAYLNLEKFRFECAFSTWLVRIALNVTNSYFKSRQFQERRQSVEISASESFGAAQAAGEESFSERDIQRLRSCIGLLEEKYRSVLVLCSFAGKTYGEAGEILCIPAGTVSSRMNVARNNLRRLFHKRKI